MTSLANSAGVFAVCCVLITAASLAGGEDGPARRAQWSLVCPPGQYVSCYENDNNICPGAICLECPPQTFSEKEDHAGKCGNCTVCRGRKVYTSVECTTSANTRCDCEFGYYASRPQEEGLMCVNNTACKHGILRRKSPRSPLTCEDHQIQSVDAVTTREPVDMTTQVPLVLSTAETSQDVTTTNLVINDETKPPPLHREAMLTKDVVKWIGIVVVIQFVLVVLACLAYMFHRYLNYKENMNACRNTPEREKVSLVINDDYIPNPIFCDDTSNQNGTMSDEVSQIKPRLTGPNINPGGMIPYNAGGEKLVKLKIDSVPSHVSPTSVPDENASRSQCNFTSNPDAYWMSLADDPVSQSEWNVAKPQFAWIPGDVVSPAQASRPELNLVEDDQPNLSSPGCLSLSLPTADSSCESY